jgi:hypothetical protein
MTIGGRRVEVTTTEGRRGAGLTLTGGPVSLTLRGTTPQGQGVPLTSDGSLILPRSGQVPTQVSGLAPNTTVTQTLYSDPLTLTSSSASSSGDFSASATLPSTLPLGQHTLSLSGTTNTGESFTLAIGVVIATPAAALGADPILSVWPRSAASSSTVTVKAHGVQAGCRVSFASGRDRTYASASRDGIATAKVVIGPTRLAQWSVRATVTGKGCVPKAVSTGVKVTSAT